MTDDSREVEDGTSAAAEEWKAAHPYKCPCWMCMHITMPWAERLGKAQQRIEELESMLNAAGAEPAVKATQLGQ